MQFRTFACIDHVKRSLIASVAIACGLQPLIAHGSRILF